MSANRNHLENKAQATEVMPNILSGCTGVQKLIYEFTFDQSWLGKPFTFFGIDSTPKQAIELVVRAGPLDELEAIIRRNPKVLLETFTKNGMRGTLLQLALINLDTSIISYNETWKQYDERMQHEGIAERLIKLYAEFFPDMQKQIEQQIQIASPEITQEHEDMHYNLYCSLNNVFNAYKEGNRLKKLASILQFNILLAQTKSKIMTDIKPTETGKNSNLMTDNRYHIILVWLIGDAFHILSKRGRELKGATEFEVSPSGYDFCFEVIAFLEDLLPPRSKQVVMSRLNEALGAHMSVPREIDIDEIFRGISTNKLGKHFFYYDLGKVGKVAPADAADFAKYSSQAYLAYVFQLREKPKSLAKDYRRHVDEQIEKMLAAQTQSSNCVLM